MRTFPKSLAAFREIVNQRGQRLRRLPYDELQLLKNAPVERLLVESRPSTIAIIVEQKPSGGIRVVVQGFMKARFFGSHVASVFVRCLAEPTPTFAFGTKRAGNKHTS